MEVDGRLDDHEILQKKEEKGGELHFHDCFMHCESKLLTAPDPTIFQGSTPFQ